jgi:mycofactocin precursor
MKEEIGDREVEVNDTVLEDPFILQEIVVEELAVDGICGIY